MAAPAQFKHGRPVKQGLYDPVNEKDSCGVGFIAHIKGKKSHGIVSDALKMLENMDHRGACGCETNTGDGAGILTALPHAFLTRVAMRDAKISLPTPGTFGAGIVFLPQDPRQRDYCKVTIAKIVADQGQKLLGWRKVPQATDAADVGLSARATEPVMEMLFIGAGETNSISPKTNTPPASVGSTSADALERQLYIIRKRATFELRNSALEQADLFYIVSLSTKVIIYKGQLTSLQLRPYFPDLAEEDFVSHLALIHSRFSTNTFPSWDRAQPMRFMAHNGEINTLRGNINWMHARESLLESPLFGQDITKCYPICEPDTSDSGTFDNTLEMLLHAGRALPHVVNMMVPEAWQKDHLIDPKHRAFFEYHSCLMEPWDGPASIAFTDGRYIGAVLDRNGLRPSRYYVTRDDYVIMASEVGVLSIDPRNVLIKGKLRPGRMFLVDFEQGRIIDNRELKDHLAAEHPYQSWLDEQRVRLDDLPRGRRVAGLDRETLMTRMQCHGFTHEDIHKLLVPIATDGQEAVGSMGNDAALAVLSDQPRMLFDYFKQMFAQVTNPPIDSTREELVMSLEAYIGPELNLLNTTPRHAARLYLPQPILTNSQLAQIRDIASLEWRTKTIDITFDRHADGSPADAMVNALERISREATQAIDDGYKLVLLTDRAMGRNRVAIPVLLATGAVHHHLVSEGTRTRIGIVVETGEAREAHHHCLLVGYGADAINPYLAFEAAWNLTREGIISQKKFTDEKITANYIKAMNKAMLKIMSKMGISTIQSYKGAQIFEAVGLNVEVIDRCFNATASRVEGIGFEAIAREAVRRHEIGYPHRREMHAESVLPSGGQYQWRSDGESHMLDPQTIAYLQAAVKSNTREGFATYSKVVDEKATRACTLRGLFAFNHTLPSVPIEEVEPAREIVKRFCTGAMSLGSISPETHETLAIAMNRIGGKSNTGEGGEDSRRYVPDVNGDSRRSAIKQVASARFGVTINYLTQADELQIKIAQGAKPGEGGQLPGHKVDRYIAGLRHSTPGVTLISPPPHHDIYSIEDLAQLIYDLKNANPSARISVKLVAETGVGTVAAGVAKAHSDLILISGHDGGTGASPLTSLKHAGGPWEIGLAEAHQTLVLNNLRSRVVLQVDGQLKTGRDVVIGALLGAEEFGFSTAPLITLGCIMMRVCHLNTCPVGIATQDPQLRAKFAGKPEHVINFFFLLAEEVRTHMAALGFRKFEDMVGRSDLLEVDHAIRHWKTQGLDLTSILTPARRPHQEVKVTRSIAQDHGLQHALDNQLIVRATPALERQQKVRIDLPISNTNRTVGTMLSHEIAKRYADEGLPEDTIRIKFTGSAGQSFGAWLASGVTLELEGDANDYVGKGLSGGHIIVYPHKAALDAGFVAQANIVAGNVVLYGATGGRAFIRGIVGERFCVRNSGATAVVEGCGDHGCEYMTNGRAVVLGSTGRNFAAGMSGGIAYVYDPEGLFPARCNPEMVELEKLDDALDIAELKQIIELHEQATGSTIARELLNSWETAIKQFHKVMPSEYKRALAEIEEESLYSASAGGGEATDLPGGIKLPVITEEPAGEKN
ncbi:MAG: glutamate synthase large subunit [Phycisphaeraceae bacterium]|nr:glutamate synthase large subunit [Phycisphaeraceae bacterium]